MGCGNRSFLKSRGKREWWQMDIKVANNQVSRNSQAFLSSLRWIKANPAVTGARQSPIPILILPFR